MFPGLGRRGEAPPGRVWSIAALGERFSKPLPSAAVLYAALDGVLARRGHRLSARPLRLEPVTPNERDAFVKAGGRVLEALESAARELDRALEKGGEPRTGPPRRYQADAMLLRYVVREAHFEMAEALHAARAVPREAWDEEGQVPSIGEETWVPKGRDPETLEPRPHVTPYDEQAGLDVLAARKRQLERFRGTPFGETAALNEIVTFRLRYAQTLEGMKPDAGRSPSESTEPPREPPTTPTTRPPGGGSGGSGPSTGR